MPSNEKPSGLVPLSSSSFGLTSGNKTLVYTLSVESCVANQIIEFDASRVMCSSASKLVTLDNQVVNALSLRSLLTENSTLRILVWWESAIGDNSRSNRLPPVNIVARVASYLQIIWFYHRQRSFIWYPWRKKWRKSLTWICAIVCVLTRERWYRSILTVTIVSYPATSKNLSCGASPPTTSKSVWKPCWNRLERR